jgi:hypothetical protein
VVRAAKTLTVASWLAAALVAFGFAATVAVAVFAPGGHPPLSAYVGFAAIMAAVPLIPLGLACAGIASLLARREPPPSPLRRPALRAAIVHGALAIVGLVLYLG